MPPVTGRFYFRLTVNDNLLGEYSNDTSKQNWVEAANRTPGNGGKYRPTKCRFVGKYKTTWIEMANGTSVLADLKIGKKRGRKKIFTLKWMVKGSLAFEGEAMLCDDLLIGNYWAQ